MSDAKIWAETLVICDGRDGGPLPSVSGDTAA
jgi:hypothetical protein